MMDGRRKVFIRPPFLGTPMVAPFFMESLIRVIIAAGTRTKGTFWQQTEVTKLVRLFIMLLFRVVTYLAWLSLVWISLEYSLRVRSTPPEVLLVPIMRRSGTNFVSLRDPTMCLVQSGVM